MIKKIYIKNFRGIKETTIDFKKLNMFIGDNGTNKTSILEAINFILSPSFLSGKIKSSDFYEGTNKPIEIIVEFQNDFKIKLPDGYTSQEVSCNKISLTIKKRERKSPGKVLSELVTVDHYVVPNFAPQTDKDGNKYWEVKRKNSSVFKFNERLLSFNVFESDEIPRSFYFNKERDKQLYKGFNTSFSSIIDDLNWRFLKKLSSLDNNEVELFYNKFKEIEQKILSLTEIEKHDVIKELNNKIDKFELDPINFSFIDNSMPFDQAVLSKKVGKIKLQTKYHGSGIEMIYSLLFLDVLSSLSKENLIILIDEPELHLHPKLQEKFANYLLELSRNEKYQIFITTHSPIFFKHLVKKDNVVSMITKKVDNNFEIKEYEQKQSIFPWGTTWGEINYFAYNYATIEFHNELYGYLQEITGKTRCNELDNYLNSEHNIDKNKKWTPERNGQPQTEENVTIMTFIRHKIHHPENRTMQSKNFTDKELKSSIGEMINILENIKSNH